jgi:diguanylate cyclase (GGDEF)-like protein/PAS domain S-box-containing protein/putative nucleotidyltransferase with HDIG domain
MNRIRPSFKLAIAMAWLSLTGVMAAQWLGVLPNVHARVLAQRISLCENLAVNCSLFLAAERQDAIQVSLDELRNRCSEIVSAGVRRSDGAMVAEVGDHAAAWIMRGQKISSENQIHVPLLQGKNQWGELEVVFRPIGETWFYGLVDRTWLQSLLLIAAVNVILFGVLLWKVLYELDPSRAAPSRVRAAFDSLTEGLLVLDNHGRIAMANSSFSRAIALPTELLVGKDAATLPFAPTKEEAPSWRDMLRAHQEVHRVEMTLPSAQGTVRTFMVNASPITEADGKRRGVLATFDDITELASRSRELVYMLGMVRESRDKIKKQNEELQFLATRDPLTGCLNRRSFFERFEAAWNSDEASNLAAIMVDIDHFKSINDGHGHATGDQVLRTVAAVLLGTTRELHFVCRYGGEEFAVLLCGMSLSAAEALSERIRVAIACSDLGDLKVTASLGLAHREFGAPSPQALLEQADKALYHSKRSGRNQVNRFDRLPDGAEEQVESTPSRGAQVALSQEVDEATRVPYHAVSSLLSALAYRDPETAAHSMRVADLAVATARGLMSAGDAYLLEIGALLHDVGKIGVPDAVLLKPGSLTKEEWVVMQSHDRIGVEIVSASFTCHELTEIIRCHHAWYGESERGSGLPSGEAIPIRARIISISDAYDAMISDRVYRKGRAPEEAFAELRKMAGKQFDPALVERFIEVVSQRAPRRQDHGSVDKEITLSLCLQTERMARAMDQRDFGAIRALAHRLEQCAAKNNLLVIRDLAAEIARLADDPAELPQLVELVHDLLELCLATQNACLAKDRANSPRGELTRP